jgi:hypothetical protein
MLWRQPRGSTLRTSHGPWLQGAMESGMTLGAQKAHSIYICLINCIGMEIQLTNGSVNRVHTFQRKKQHLQIPHICSTESSGHSFQVEWRHCLQLDYLIHVLTQCHIMLATKAGSKNCVKRAETRDWNRRFEVMDQNHGLIISEFLSTSKMIQMELYNFRSFHMNRVSQVDHNFLRSLINVAITWGTHGYIMLRQSHILYIH